MSFIERIGIAGDHYLTRVKLGFGFYLHIFHRGDADRWPHDHPWDFWTFPLRGYEEEVWVGDGILWPWPAESYHIHAHPEGGFYYIRRVRAFRWHKRRAEHRHRVIWDRRKKRGPLVTLVWHEPKRRHWGFWIRGRTFVHWTHYVNSVSREYEPGHRETVR